MQSYIALAHSSVAQPGFLQKTGLGQDVTEISHSVGKIKHGEFVGTMAHLIMRWPLRDHGRPKSNVGATSVTDAAPSWIAKGWAWQKPNSPCSCSCSLFRDRQLFSHLSRASAMPQGRHPTFNCSCRGCHALALSPCFRIGVSDALHKCLDQTISLARLGAATARLSSEGLGTLGSCFLVADVIGA